MNDFLTELIRQVLETAAEPNAARTAEIRIRQQYGGERVYIGKAPTKGKVQRLAESLAAGASPREAFRSAGVSKSAGYRMLARKWGPR